jgi:hypothetical protein
LLKGQAGGISDVNQIAHVDVEVDPAVVGGVDF